MQLASLKPSTASFSTSNTMFFEPRLTPGFIEISWVALHKSLRLLTLPSRCGMSIQSNTRVLGNETLGCFLFAITPDTSRATMAVMRVTTDDIIPRAAKATANARIASLESKHMIRSIFKEARAKSTSVPACDVLSGVAHSMRPRVST